MIASFLSEELSKLDKRIPEREITLLFFFSASDATRRTLDTLTRTLLVQLLENDTDGKLVPLFNTIMEKGLPSTSNMFDAIQDAIVLLIIDGIGECSDIESDTFTSWPTEQTNRAS